MPMPAAEKRAGGTPERALATARPLFADGDADGDRDDGLEREHRAPRAVVGGGVSTGQDGDLKNPDNALVGKQVSTVLLE